MDVNQRIISRLATELSVRPEQFAATVELLDGGATVPFDASSADLLRQLLGAVARFARGGLKALQDSGAAGDQLLLAQLKKGP